MQVLQSRQATTVRRRYGLREVLRGITLRTAKEVPAWADLPERGLRLLVDMDVLSLKVGCRFFF